MSIERIEGREAGPGEGVREEVLKAGRGLREGPGCSRGMAGQLPEGVLLLEHVERLHRAPAAERSLSKRPGWATARSPCRSGQGRSPWRRAGLCRDHCPTGLSVLLPCPAGVGTVLCVLLPAEMGGGWVTVEVRHCRREAGGWVAGCESLRGQPPI